MSTYLTHLECADCGASLSAEVEQHRCSCGGILLARYDLAGLKRDVHRQRIEARPWNDGLWRYVELLPVAGPKDRVSLGEGATPLLPLSWLSEELGVEVWMKDEGLLRPEQVSFGKLNNVREALEIAREARTILGASGITLDHPAMRHASNLESVLTYEGTSEIHSLIIGQALTGLRAFD